MSSRVALAVVDVGTRRRPRSWSPWATILLMLVGEVCGLWLVRAGAPLVGMALCAAAASGIVWLPSRPAPARPSAGWRSPTALCYRGVVITRPEHHGTRRAPGRRTAPVRLRLCPSVARDGSRYR
ncbi:MAG TPA: hypothetical protein VGK30_11590 [Candidatus Binatia bacterium]|jgi:hypothetical protein